MESLTILPHKAVIFLNLELGFTLGLILSLADFVTFYTQKRLQIAEAQTIKYLAWLTVVTVGVAGGYVVLLTVFLPDYATRSEIYNNSIEEIGFGFAIALVLISQFV